MEAAGAEWPRRRYLVKVPSLSGSVIKLKSTKAGLFVASCRSGLAAGFVHG